MLRDSKDSNDPFFWTSQNWMYEIVLQPCKNKKHHSFGGQQKREMKHSDMVLIFACVNV